MSEATFLSELARATGCGLLLDVNNVYVSAQNLGFDAWEFIDELPVAAIGEIHLAGHATNQAGDDTVLIDDHGSRVPPSVWALFRRTIEKTGPRPILIEWDSALPDLQVLLGEAMWADLLSQSVRNSAERHEFSAGRNAGRNETVRDRMTDAFPGSGSMMPALAACVVAGHFKSGMANPNGRNHHVFA